jgi:hypothetical protein
MTGPLLQPAIVEAAAYIIKASSLRIDGEVVNSASVGGVDLDRAISRPR